MQKLKTKDRHRRDARRDDRRDERRGERRDDRRDDRVRSAVLAGPPRGAKESLSCNLTSFACHGERPRHEALEVAS